MTSDILRANLYDDGNGCVRLVLEGELDLTTAPMLAEKITEACRDQPAKLLIDLTELTHCDSSGLREFVRAAEVCASNDTDLRIVGATGIVRRVFDITGLADTFSFEP
jgi:anti-sigma B factor antagonist